MAAPKEAAAVANLVVGLSSFAHLRGAHKQDQVAVELSHKVDEKFRQKKMPG